jgi:hypothetical protein
MTDLRLPKRDPEAAHARKQKAIRRVGPNTKCACGESRPEALIPGSKPTICAKCQRRKNGMSTTDDHHVAAEANSPETIPTPVNDHRADLSVAQHDWPERTLENPDGSPLLRIAGCIRGFMDYLIYLVKTFLHWIPEALETADALLTETLGAKWWISTPLEQFAPKG